MIFIEQQINNTLTVWSPLNIFSKLISQVKVMGEQGIAKFRDSEPSNLCDIKQLIQSTYISDYVRHAKERPNPNWFEMVETQKP